MKTAHGKVDHSEEIPGDKVADRISVEFCPDCNSLHFVLMRKGELVGIAVPHHSGVLGFVADVVAAMDEKMEHNRGRH